MNLKLIEKLAEQAKTTVPDGLDVAEWIRTYNNKLSELIINECIEACPHEDGRNHIRKHFHIN